MEEADFRPNISGTDLFLDFFEGSAAAIFDSNDSFIVKEVNFTFKTIQRTAMRADPR